MMETAPFHWRWFIYWIITGRGHPEHVNWWRKRLERGGLTHLSSVEREMYRRAYLAMMRARFAPATPGGAEMMAEGKARLSEPMKAALAAMPFTLTMWGGKPQGLMPGRFTMATLYALQNRRLAYWTKTDTFQFTWNRRHTQEPDDE